MNNSNGRKRAPVKPQPNREIDPAIARLRAEGWLGKIATALGVNRQATHKWLRVPAERVIEVSRITGISPSELRNDLYPAGSKIKQPVDPVSRS
jgi:DNA-binding transcriptional regulator YdaS (Cro superfamily)